MTNVLHVGGAVSPDAAEQKSRFLRIERLVSFALLLAAPWFVLRPAGARFDQGTSFYIADVFFCCAVLLSLLQLMRADARASAPASLWWMLAAGLGFLVWAPLSAVAGLRPADAPAVNIGPFASGLVQYGYVMIGLPLVSYLVGRALSFDEALKALAIGSALPMLANVLLMGWWSPVELKEVFVSYGRANGPVGNPNVFSVVICMAVPAYLYLLTRPERLWRFLGVGFSALAIALLLLTVSFSGILVFALIIACTAAFLAVVYRRTVRSHLGRIVGVVAVIVVLTTAITTFAVATSREARVTMSYRFVPLINAVSPSFSFPSTVAPAEEDDLTSSALIELEDVGSAGIRLELINRGLSVIQQRNLGLLFGHGMRQTSTMPQFQFGSEGLDVHLVYILLWIEAGGIGVALYILYFAVLAVLAARVRGFDIIVRYAALAPVGVFILAGFFMPHMYLRFFWVPLVPAMMLVLVRDLPKREF